MLAIPGDAYEYLIGQFASGAGKKAGGCRRRPKALRSKNRVS